MSVPDSSLCVLADAFALLAYGAAPGMELIPYFLALLAWIGMALAAILLWPVTAVIRRLRRGRSDSRTVDKLSNGTEAIKQIDAKT